MGWKCVERVYSPQRTLSPLPARTRPSATRDSKRATSLPHEERRSKRRPSATLRRGHYAGVTPRLQMVATVMWRDAGLLRSGLGGEEPGQHLADLAHAIRF